MKLFWRTMKEAAYARHAALVSLFYGHDKDKWRDEMNRHYRFVDLVYSGVLPVNR